MRSRASTVRPTLLDEVTSLNWRTTILKLSTPNRMPHITSAKIHPLNYPPVAIMTQLLCDPPNHSVRVAYRVRIMQHYGNSDATSIGRNQPFPGWRRMQCLLSSRGNLMHVLCSFILEAHLNKYLQNIFKISPCYCMAAMRGITNFDTRQVARPPGYPVDALHI